MPDAPEVPEEPARPRRSFIEPAPPKPFYKTREGRRVLVLAGCFVIAGIVMYRQYQKAAAVVERKQAEKALAEAEVPVVPVEVRLEQKRAELATIYEGALLDSQNGDDFVETGGYRKLVEVLAGYTPEEITAKATTYLDYAAAMEEPDLARGEFVHVRGLVGDLWAVKLERPVHGITDVWRGTIAQPDVSENVAFDLVGDPPPLERQFTVVEVDGLLYRTVGFESRTGQQREVPYLLARNLRVIEEARPKNGTGEKVLVIALGVFAIFLYLLLRYSWRSRKRPAGWSARHSRNRSLKTPRNE